jgi:voltage-gated potassium channel
LPGIGTIGETRHQTVFDTTRQSVASASDRLLGSPLRNLAFGLIYMVIVMTGGVIAYVRAGWKLGDALYMVILTVYTVGYGEVQPIDTPLLRTITMSVIVLGCTGVIYLTGALVQFITLSEINQIFGVKRMNTQIDRLRNHVIVCGFGRIGAMLAKGLHAGGASFIVIEANDAAVAQARSLGYLCIHADAASETALQDAHIEHARALATVLSNDAANVFITLSARSLNPELEIIARGEVPSTEMKLLQAGANKVVLPTHIGAERIAEMLLYQETARFIRGSDRMRDFEKVLLSLGLELHVVTAASQSPAIGKTIEQLEQQASGGFFVVQLDRKGGEAMTRPAPSVQIEAGDGLVLVGRAAQARALSALFEAGRGGGYRVSAR